MRHELKIWPVYFDQVRSGNKLFEIRNNDMDFKVGDEVMLKEFDPSKKEYSGRAILVLITYLTDFNQKQGFVVFSFHRKQGKF